MGKGEVYFSRIVNPNELNTFVVSVKKSTNMEIKFGVVQTAVSIRGGIKKEIELQHWAFDFEKGKKHSTKRKAQNYSKSKVKLNDKV